MFSELNTKIKQVSGTKDFISATSEIINYIDKSENVIDILKQIGTIPESMGHDTTEEKLFSKASDAVLARAFRELGLRSRVLADRSDSADVIAESDVYNYSLVADAKSFRMSRTAKNQKDFKVSALSNWRGDNDYAVLCSPYFQLPRVSSQIYAQATTSNVCLFSWEHIIFLLEKGIKETNQINLSSVWKFSKTHGKTCTVSNLKKSFIEDFNIELVKLAGSSITDLNHSLEEQVRVIQTRGNLEKDYWVNRISEIRKYSREQAIEELIKSQNISGKIAQINTYVRGLRV